MLSLLLLATSLDYSNIYHCRWVYAILRGIPAISESGSILDSVPNRAFRMKWKRHFVQGNEVHPRKYKTIVIIHIRVHSVFVVHWVLKRFELLLVLIPINVGRINRVIGSCVYLSSHATVEVKPKLMIIELGMLLPTKEISPRRLVALG